MDFGIWDILFLFAIIFLAYRDLKKKFYSKENEIDRVLREAEQVKYKNIENLEIIYIRSEIVNEEIYICWHQRKAKDNKGYYVDIY